MHGPFCSEEEEYFTRHSDDFDMPVQIRGRWIGNLIPGHVTLPDRGRFGFFGCNTGDEFYGGDIGIGTGMGMMNPLLAKISPYNPRNICSSRCWCPGGGLGLSCCSVFDTGLGTGSYRLRRCPRGLPEAFF